MNFLEKYTEYCKNNECPDTYHTFSALGVLAALTGRKIRVEQGYWTYYGNLYIVLVGPAGTGKSVATDISVQLMDEIGGVPYSSECVSPRKLLEEMGTNQAALEIDGKVYQHAPLVAVPSELSNFISQNAQLMIDTITTIWDRPKHKYGTAHKGMVELFGPCLTILTCATPAWITNNLRTDIISGGFSRRTLWVYETDRGNKVIPRPSLTPQMEGLWKELVAHGRRVQEVKGKFVWDRDAEVFFDKWYGQNKKQPELALGGYRESKPGFILKLSMLLSMSDQLELVIRKRFLEEALVLLGSIEAHLHRVFEGIGRNELNAVANNVLEMIEQAGGRMPETILRGLAFRIASGKELDEILYQLVRTEKLRRENCGGSIELRIVKKELQSDQPIKTKQNDIEDTKSEETKCEPSYEASGIELAEEKGGTNPTLEAQTTSTES